MSFQAGKEESQVIKQQPPNTELTDITQRPEQYRWPQATPPSPSTLSLPLGRAQDRVPGTCTGKGDGEHFWEGKKDTQQGL